MVSTVLKTVQVPQLLFIDKFVDILVVVVQRQVAMVLTVQQNLVEIPQVHLLDKIVDILVCCATTGAHGLLYRDPWRFHSFRSCVRQVDVPRGASCAGSTGAVLGEDDRDNRSLEKSLRSLKSSVQGGQTTENLDTAPVAQTEIVVVVKIGALLPTESANVVNSLPNCDSADLKIETGTRCCFQSTRSSTSLSWRRSSFSRRFRRRQ